MIIQYNFNVIFDNIEYTIHNIFVRKFKTIYDIFKKGVVNYVT